MNPGEDPRRASLTAALDAADDALVYLRLDNPKRAEIARRIRAIEAAIDELGDAG